MRQSRTIQSEAAIGLKSSPLRSKYLGRQLGFDVDQEKQECRDRVSDFILSHHAPGGIKLLSFPSLRWAFEHQLYERHGNVFFIGLEKDDRVFRRSVAWMPGTLRRASVDEARFDLDFRLHWAENRCARLLHIDCSTFLRIRRMDVLNKEQRYWWSNCFRGWSAVWLDFTSPICRDVEVSLSELSGGCIPMIDVPIVATVLKARECPDVQTKMGALQLDRAGYIARLIGTGARSNRAFDVIETHEYISGSGTPMLSVMGVLRASVNAPIGNPRPIALRAEKAEAPHA